MKKLLIFLFIALLPFSAISAPTNIPDVLITDVNNPNWVDVRRFTDIEPGLTALANKTATLRITKDVTLDNTYGAGTYSGVTVHIMPGFTCTITNPATYGFNVIVEDKGILAIDADVTIGGNLTVKGDPNTAIDKITGDEVLTVSGIYNKNVDISHKILHVAGISNLRLTVPIKAGEVRYLDYHTTLHDGGEGDFIWDATSFVADNNGTIIQVTGVTTGRWIRQYSGSVSVKWFGARGDGTHDDSDAIIAARNYLWRVAIAGAEGIWSPGGVYMGPLSGSTPEWFFPSGVYKISKSLSGPTQDLNFMRIRGDNAVIVPTNNTIIVFGGVGYNNKIEGIIFRGGSKHIVGNNNNNNSTMLDVVNCEFINANDAAIDMGGQTGGISSANVTIRNCKFYCTGVSGNGFLFSGGSDLVVIKDCWLETDRLVGILHRKGLLRIENCTGVPENNKTGIDGSRWVHVTDDAKGAALVIDKFRAGAEGGGRTMVRWAQDPYTTDPRVPSRISITNSEVYAQPGTYIVVFDGFPNIVELENLSGLVLCDGLYFTNSITEQATQDFATFGTVRINSNNDGRIVLQPKGPNTRAFYTFISKIDRGDGFGRITSAITDGPIPVSSIVVSDSVHVTWTSSGDVVSAYNVTNDKGLDVVRYFTATDGGWRYHENETFLDPSVVTEQLYYLSVHVKVISGYWQTNVLIGPTVKAFDLAPGNYTLIVPFYYYNNSGVADPDLDRLKIYASTPGYGDMYIGRAVVTKDFFVSKSETLELEGSAAPSTGTYITDDKVLYYNPATAGYIGTTCTVAGTPGTWKRFGSIAP